MRFFGAPNPTSILVYPVFLGERPFSADAQYVVRTLKLNADD